MVATGEPAIQECLAKSGLPPLLTAFVGGDFAAPAAGRPRRRVSGHRICRRPVRGDPGRRRGRGRRERARCLAGLVTARASRARAAPKPRRRCAARPRRSAGPAGDHRRGQAAIPGPRRRRDERPLLRVLRGNGGQVRQRDDPAAAGHLRLHGARALRRRRAHHALECAAQPASPWVAPCLAAGNTVVVKPSELTPLTSVFARADGGRRLPGGVCNVVLGAGDPVCSAWRPRPGSADITFTGSVAAGRRVGAVAADAW